MAGGRSAPRELMLRGRGGEGGGWEEGALWVCDRGRIGSDCVACGGGGVGDGAGVCCVASVVCADARSARSAPRSPARRASDHVWAYRRRRAGQVLRRLGRPGFVDGGRRGATYLVRGRRRPVAGQSLRPDVGVRRSQAAGGVAGDVVRRARAGRRAPWPSETGGGGSSRG